MKGVFPIQIYKSNTTKLGEAVKLSFIITQHYRDEQLMRSLMEYLDCGNVLKHSENVVGFELLNFQICSFAMIKLFRF